MGKTGGRSQVQCLAEFVSRCTWEHLEEDCRAGLKLRVLDALGCAFGALGAPPVESVRKQVELLGGKPVASLIGGGMSSPDRAALHNGATIRYLDFNDCYLGREEACHPSDNLAPVLAAAEFAGGSGKHLLTALAVAYQVQCRLSAEAPVRARGFDHATQGAYAAAAGAAKALGLDATRTAHAVAISGTAFNSLRVTRTGRISHWKGLAYPAVAFAAVNAAFLAMQGITGPAEVFEGSKGFMESIAGKFELDWDAEGLDAVRQTVVKRYNAEGHAQAALEAVFELRREHSIEATAIEALEADVFGPCYEIIGPGAGDKTSVSTKEEADHSLPYMLSVALLDGRVMPDQYELARIGREDVQRLMRRVTVRDDPALTAHFPQEHRVRIRIRLENGVVLERQHTDWEGSTARPAGRAIVEDKFRLLAEPVLGSGRAEEIRQAVVDLETADARQLAALLRAPDQQAAPSTRAL
jgi:2-methylcitrate dehydratase